MEMPQGMINLLLRECRLNKKIEKGSTLFLQIAETRGGQIMRRFRNQIQISDFISRQ